MNKQELITSITAAFDKPATVRSVADALGITTAAVGAWPEQPTRAIFRNVAGDFIRINKKIPVDIVAALRAAL